MKIAVFSAQPYDRQFLDAANAAEGHDLKYFEAALGLESVAHFAEAPVALVRRVGASTTLNAAMETSSAAGSASCSKESSPRITGTSTGASMPSRTALPLVRRTVIVMLLPMRIFS